MSEPWEFDRASNNVFAGPLALTAAADGSPVDPSGVQFAVVPRGTRPGVSDWTDPVADPDPADPDNVGIGVNLTAVTEAGSYGWWVKITAAATTYILEPDAVGWIIRG